MRFDKKKERELEENLLRLVFETFFLIKIKLCLIWDFQQNFREKLRQEWVEQQEKLKNEDIEIVYSYWDGSGHRRNITLKKGNSIQQFLYRALDSLRKENQFNELKIISVDQLMYVKEDIILPHHYTFYDLIVTKARGKSGPLFIFDCHDDIRIQNDASIEKEESHAGKVVLRSKIFD
jgi:protein FAM50